MTLHAMASLVAATYAGIALFFLVRFTFHMLAALADRKNKSLGGTLNPRVRYSPSNYSADGWQHLVKSHRNAVYFALMIVVPLLLGGVVWMIMGGFVHIP
jgi:hypothetical protein